LQLKTPSKIKLTTPVQRFAKGSEKKFGANKEEKHRYTDPVFNGKEEHRDQDAGR
jgi:hypothetical protein